jgi:hypothetical protein
MHIRVRPEISFVMAGAGRAEGALTPALSHPWRDGRGGEHGRPRLLLPLPCAAWERAGVRAAARLASRVRSRVGTRKCLVRLTFSGSFGNPCQVRSPSAGHGRRGSLDTVEELRGGRRACPGRKMPWPAPPMICAERRRSHRRLLRAAFAADRFGSSPAGAQGGPAEPNTS